MIGCCSPRPSSLLCPLGEAIELMARPERDDARWIFHIGHVGSTLISRLLGELGGLLAIREPRSLRDLGFAADVERPRLAVGLRRMMARAFRPGQMAVVKATSFVSEFAPLLVAPDMNALFLYASPVNYVAGILAGENSVKELDALHEIRATRLESRGIVLAGFDRDDAHRAAAAWACEMTSLEAAADEMADRQILWADFDTMLLDMVGWLGRSARHLGIEPSPGTVEKLVAGPLMRRYSKALEYDYSPQLRAELLFEAKRDHMARMDAALASLRKAARDFPLLSRALARAEREN